ncbi:hypothetical protein SFC65_20400 [Priestia filamentosa]|uniref:hypothetical protein n=1 Tax=Priestia filamentosa TaxID=1402861 RepID=UPI0039825B2C
MFFYEFPAGDPILTLLRTTSIRKNYRLFNACLDFNLLYEMSVGNIKEIPSIYRKSSLNELFGEDTEILRTALMESNPGAYYEHPHNEFEERFFNPALYKQIDTSWKNPTLNPGNIFRK